MSELARLLLFVAIAGTAVTFMGSFAIWYGDEDRRIRRALRNVLKSEPEGVIVARGRGRGAGFSFSTNLLAVAWDRGGWCLVYRLEELTGAELLVDNQVMGRVFRGEGRRAIDHMSPQAETVTLRLVFDDPRHPDFTLDLWAPGDEQRRESRSSSELVQEANRWLARCEAIVRRPLPPRPEKAAPATVAAPPPPPPPPRQASPTRPVAPPPQPVDDDPYENDPYEDDETTFDPPPASAPVASPTSRHSTFDQVARPAAAPSRSVEPDMFDDPPWDDDPPASLPQPEPAYKPVSKAKRETPSDQNELPFDLDD
ncbi:hypothetical protein B7G68_07275 [Caulobacter segnis]|uniref:Uncharacterized protein n=2 Tax=Caulobacter segnis TaxID=88688 RepID=D5VIU1_CAUST|nr:hypothetical protein [Caulobacter segnis]ADG09907.1 conserved hypothetical protein [Caulobacter segnis ATCC 21756]AVQ01665.1 hypothetical protein B7G68_07275 [Caulobacter segnis]